MTTVTQKPKSVKRNARTAAVLLWRPLTKIGLIRLTETAKHGQKAIAHYHLQELPTDLAGRAFRCEKHGHEEESSYDVLVDGRNSICECKGFNRWGHCKHVEALTALVAAGKLAEGGVG